MSELRAALEQLSTHPGWQAFLKEAKRRWGPEGYARELKKAVSEAIEHRDSAETAVRIVDRVNDEVNGLLTWVSDTVRQETMKEEREHHGLSVSRRGPNL